MDLLKTIVLDSLNEDDIFNLLKDNFAGETEEFTETLSGKIEQAFIRSAAVTSLLHIFRQSGDFEGSLNEYFRTFRKMLDEVTAKAFEDDIFETVVAEKDFIRMSLERLPSHRREELKKLWIDSKRSSYQDAVTEFVSSQKTGIILAYRKLTQGNEG